MKRESIAGVFALLAVSAAWLLPVRPEPERTSPVTPNAELLPVDFSSGPIAAAYSELHAAENRHEQQFRDALDPEAAAVARQQALEKAIEGRSSAALVGIGADLFIADRATPKRIRHGATTRCASCHAHGRVGGSGGLVDDNFDGLVPPSLEGAALLERAASEMTRDLRAAAKKGGSLTSKGVFFGTAKAPSGVAADLLIRPFGARGRWATIDEAIEEMETKAVAPHSGAERRALSEFVHSLAAPSVIPPDAARLPDLYYRFGKGQARFEAIGCGNCHVAELRLDDGTSVRALTDLRFHEMGEKLATAANSRWMTRPLWSVAIGAPYLHDGRALGSLDLAIGLHGGEAAEAAKRYAALPVLERGEIRMFLQSLLPAPRIRIAGP